MKVLIVDDERDVEPLFRQKLRREVRSGELELLFAFSGQHALDLLEKHGYAGVVLVLSDINMPGMTGIELLQKIKSTPPPLPVCMMTAYDNETYRSKAEASGCDGYVAKPVDFTKLKAQIRELATA